MIIRTIQLTNSLDIEFKDFINLSKKSTPKGTPFSKLLILHLHQIFFKFQKEYFRKNIKTNHQI